MKSRRGWECGCCRAVVLEYRRKRQATCPVCKTAMGVECEARDVVNIDAADFPKKPRHHPNQTDIFEHVQEQLAAEHAAQNNTPAFIVED